MLIEDSLITKNGIIQLLEDDELRQQMGENCQEIAYAEYSLDIQVKRYSDLYYQVLHGSHKD